MPPPQDVRRHQDGQVAHVVFLGGAAERRKAGQFREPWSTAHGVGFLPGKVAHHQRTGSAAQMDIGGISCDW